MNPDADTADAQPPTLTTGTVADIPRPAQALTRALAPGWTATITRARGPLTRTRRATSNTGKGCLTTETVQVNSVCLRARHHDGRGLIALWIQPPPVKASTAPAYSFDMAWRGRHAGENVPAPLNATEVKAYAAAVGADNALAAVQTVRDEQTARTEARRAGKRAAPEPGEGVLTLDLPVQRADEQDRAGVAA